MVNTNTKNIILIGRTGSGKSTLANVLVNEDKFAVGGGSISKTKSIEEGTFEIDLRRDGSEKIKYRIIDTIGLGDTNLTPQGVLMRLAEMAGRVKREGLNQILFVTKGRFTKEEIEAYDLLSSIIFDKNVIKYTTIVKTGFEEFENEEICEEDREILKMESEDLAHIIGHVKVFYVDNPPLKGRSAATNKEIRKESRRRLLIYLATCEGNYRPSNIDDLDARVKSYTTNEEKLQKKLEELETIRKEEREKHLKEVEKIRKEQTEELSKMKEQNRKDIHNVEEKSRKELEETTNKMRSEHKKDVDNLKHESKENINNLKSSYEREAQTLKSSFESRINTLQDQNKRDREATEDLRKELREKNSSSAKAIEASMASLKVDDSKREERLTAEAKVRDKELDIQKEANKAEQARLDKISDAKAKQIEQETEAKQKKADQDSERHAFEMKRTKEGIWGKIKGAVAGRD